MSDGHLEPLRGVTNTVHIIDKSEPLMRWAVKKCLEAIRAKTRDHLRPDGFYEIHVEEFEQILEAARKTDRDLLDEAADIGHQAHTWLEGVITEKLAGNENRLHELLAKLPLDERACNCCIAAVEWMVRHNVKWVATERKVYSRKHGYAGTMDGLAYCSSCDDPMCCPEPFTDVLSIVDWKSSNQLVVTYLLQVAAYWAAYVEETGEPIKDRWIIRLGKEDGEFDPWHRPGSTLFLQDFTAFTDALNLNHSVEAVEDNIAETKEKRRAAMKLRAQAAKEEALKKKCAGADKYKGIRKPKCNGGNPCEACLAKYAETHPSSSLS